MNRLLVIALWLCVWPAFAVDLYYCECSTGAHPSCVAGNNANAGTSAAAPKQTFAGEELFGRAAGDRFLICAGGVLAYTAAPFIEAAAVNEDNPIIIEPYAPPTGATGRPILRNTGSGQGLTIGGTFPSNLHGSYIIRNIRLEGATDGQWGVLINAGAIGVTLDNVESESWDIGVHTAHSFVATYGMQRNLTIRNSSLSFNRSMGMLGGSTNTLVENNIFEGNNVGNIGDSPFSHGIYLGCNNVDCSNSIIRYNTFLGNSIPAGETYCAGGNLTAHGHLDGLLIEGNDILNASAIGTCAGVSLTAGYDSPDESFQRVVIRGNRIVNTGVCALCTNSAPGLVIENNLIVHTHSGFQAAIQLGSFTPDEDPQINNIVRNNTCWFTNPGAGSNCIDATRESGHRITNNLAFFSSSATNTHRCFNIGALANFAEFDRNLCFSAGTNGTWSQTYSNLAAAQAAGFDLTGIAANPLFATTPSTPYTWSCNVQSGSPAINAGNSSASRLAFRGWRAVGTRDIGACEFGSTP